MDPPSATYSPASCQISMMRTSTDQVVAYEQQDGRRQIPVRDAMYNHYYYGPVNHIGQATNSSFGTNYGRIDQVMHPDATSAHSRGLPTWHSTDVFSLLNPILDASHTRNMNISPPNSQCLPGTRKDVIQDIQMWADSDLDTDPHMLWIFGYAGCGKSAIAHEIAKYYARQGRLAASFAFFRGSGDRSTAARFATTVASQVAAAVPETEPYIESTVRRCPGLLSTNTASLSDQFERLVYLPIHAIASHASAPFLIVLDGIDECQDGTDISMLIEAMIDFFNRQARTPLRFLITSRVEDHLHQVLHSSNQVRLLNLVEKTSDADIASALTVAIQKEARGQVLSRHGPWPSAEDKERLVKHIGGSFIFMSTIVKRLFDRSIKDVRTPMERLPLVLSMKPDFDDLYKEILTPCQHFSHFHAVMNTLILAFRPLSVAEVADIINIKTYDVANVLINMQAIIQVPGDDRTPVTLWHTSLRDYLTAENRSGPLAANPSHQRWLAYRCVSLAAASAKATYHPSLAYSQEYAVGHLAKLVKISTTDQSLELLVHELQKVMDALQMPVYKGNQTALEAACRGRHWKLVTALINAGANVNVQFYKEPLDGMKCALHATCSHKRWDLIYLLLEKGADPNIVSPSEGTVLIDCTPLTFAVRKNDVKLAARLLECGANPNLQGGFYGTALRAACVAGSLEVVNLLLDHGADPNLQGAYDNASALHECACHGYAPLARALLTHNANPDIQDNIGNTPLHGACRLGKIKAVECLLEFKADTSKRNNEGWTALQVAKKEGKRNVIKVLRRHCIVAEYI